MPYLFEHRQEATGAKVAQEITPAIGITFSIRSSWENSGEDPAKGDTAFSCGTPHRNSIYGGSNRNWEFGFET
jgi:hypothetical protein